MGQNRLGICEILAQQSLLEYVPPVEIDRLADLATTQAYQTDQVIFRRGDPGLCAMLILSGRVQICTTSAEGRNVVLAVIGRNEIFGEIAMIDGGARTADAIAMEATELLALDREVFHQFLERNPQACVRLLEILCDRFRWTDEAVTDLNIFNLRPRLAKRLITLCDQYGEPVDNGMKITIRLSEQILAGMMGSTREAVKRQLKSWADAELIEFEGGFVTIADRTGLERIVQKLCLPAEV